MQNQFYAASLQWMIRILAVMILLLPQGSSAQTGEHLCTVTAQMLNLRSGPGTDYTPPLARLQTGTQLKLRAKNSDASWVEVQVQVQGVELIGWVSSSSQNPNINCGGYNMASLPLGQIPPRPDGVFPARSAVRPVPTPGANAGDLLGLIYAGGDYTYSPDDSGTTLIFRGEFALELVVFDPREGVQNGAGIDYVEVEIYDPEFELVYEDRIDAPQYCMPISNQGCGTLALTRNGRWPNGRTMLAGEYSADITAYPDDEDLQQGNWSLDFEVRLADASGNPLPDLEASVVEAFRGDAVVGQVWARDPAAGTHDGAGIANVYLAWYDPSGGLLYDRTEQAAPYCLFSNEQGSSTCNEWPLAAGSWPNGQTIRSGDYFLYIVVTAQDNRQVELDQTLSIQVNN
jgi:hypothetical protein